MEEEQKGGHGHALLDFPLIDTEDDKMSVQSCIAAKFNVFNVS